MSNHTITNTTPLTNRISRISWGGVLAGGVTALSIALLLNLLGAGIGLATIDPTQEANPLDGLGIGTIIWWTVSNLLALFGGGWIAARTAGFTNREDGGIHGFLAWSFYAVVSFFLLTSTVSGVVNGVGGAMASIFGSDNNKQVTVELDRAKQTSERNVNTSFAAMKEDVFNLINKAERLNIVPNDASKEIRSAAKDVRGNVKDAWNDLNVDGNVNRFFNNLSYNLDENGDLNIEADGTYFDKEGVKEYLTEHTELNRDEINGVITKWDKNINQGIQKAERYYAMAKQKAIVYSEEAAEAMSTACIMAFLALLTGAFAGFFGGTFGAPKHTVAAVNTNTIDDDTVVRAQELYR